MSKIFAPLVLSAAIMAALPGTAAAISAPFTDVDFCSDASYDNNDPQVTGYFTDVRRGTQINDDYGNCVLNLTGATGSAGDMWITIMDGAEGSPFSCVEMRGEVLIKKFDNRKAVGFVTNYSFASGTGIFFGVYDNGNTDALTISTFNAATGQLGATVGTLAMGSKIKENVWYALRVRSCNNGVEFDNTSLFEVRDPAATLLGQIILDGVDLPAGISAVGEVGIAGYAKSAFVDSSVRNLSVVDFNFAP